MLFFSHRRLKLTHFANRLLFLATSIDLHKGTIETRSFTRYRINLNINYEEMLKLMYSLGRFRFNQARMVRKVIICEYVPTCIYFIYLILCFLAEFVFFWNFINIVVRQETTVVI